MVSSLLFVVTLAFQAAQPQASNGFHAANVVETKTEPPRPLTIEMRGDILMARKMYREAIEKYKEGPPDSAVLANKIGIGYHQLLDLDNAKKYYQRAVKLDREYAEAINNLGTIYYAKKSYRRAVNEYKKALRIKPDSASMMSNLGTAYFARKHYDQAFELYQKAIELDPEVFEHRGTTGVLLQERSVEERAKFHYTLAKTYAKTGRNDLALVYIRKAIEEGFKERDRFEKDPEFAGLHDDPEFKKLMEMEQKVL
jgi:tetratricopeptide (TPR) repeat protein